MQALPPEGKGAYRGSTGSCSAIRNTYEETRGTARTPISGGAARCSCNVRPAHVFPPRYRRPINRFETVQNFPLTCTRKGKHLPILARLGRYLENQCRCDGIVLETGTMCAFKTDRPSSSRAIPLRMKQHAQCHSSVRASACD